MVGHHLRVSSPHHPLKNPITTSLGRSPFNLDLLVKGDCFFRIRGTHGMKITMSRQPPFGKETLFGSLFSKHLFQANPSWANHSKTRKSKSKLGFASHSRKQKITAGLPSNERCRNEKVGAEAKVELGES